MNRARFLTALTVAAMAASPAFLTADVSSEQKSHVEFTGVLGRMVNLFGGRAAKEGVTSTIAIKGNRLSSTTDQTEQIIDLDEQKVYELDLRRRTYSVATFAEMRQRLEDARRKAEENAQKAQAEPKREPSAGSQEKEKQVDVDLDVRNTGQTRSINGYDTHETIVTVTVREKGRTLEQSGGLVLTSDMWLAPRIPALQEIPAFYQRYAKAVAGPELYGASVHDMTAALTMYPTLKNGLARMREEGGKIDGTAILTTLTIDAVKSADEIAAEKRNEDSSSSSGSDTIGGLLGRFAKKRADKKKAADETPGRSTFMTITSEVLKVTPAASAAEVAIPAGFSLK
jgi:hypothetical protein